MAISPWIDNPQKLVARLVKVYTGALRVTLEDGYVCFRYGDAMHSIKLSVSSTWRILHHLAGFAENVGVPQPEIYRGGAFYVGFDAQGRDQLREISRVRKNAWSWIRGEYGIGVHGRIHYKTRPPGKERRLRVIVEPAKKED
jgi:hypothetical protein